MIASCLFEISINDIYDQPMHLGDYKGKKIMIVNVASQCGFTIQYDQLQQLYTTYGDKLVIIGCPCNDFGGQETGSSEEIQDFCRVNFGVTFPLTEKLSIRSHPHPLYEWLMAQEIDGVSGHEVHWNFHKFLISESGHLVKNHSSIVAPMSEEILGWLES
ncbi:MAG: glutathione peroxidase [Saprospiraceae bacterium]